MDLFVGNQLQEKYLTLECIFIIKYGNNVHSIEFLKLDVYVNFLLESTVCNYYILCLLRIHVVINENLVSNRGYYDNTHEHFIGGKLCKEITEVKTFETCKDYQTESFCGFYNSSERELVQIIHHDVGGAATLLAWCLSVFSVAQVVISRPLLSPFRPISGCAEATTSVLASGRRTRENFLVDLTTVSFERDFMRGELSIPGASLGTNLETSYLFLNFLRFGTVTSREEAGEVRDPLRANGRRTRLGSFCKSDLLVTGSLLVHDYICSTFGKFERSYPDVMAASMRGPALLRHEVFGSSLHEVDVIHLVIGIEKAVDRRGVSRDARDGIYHLVPPEGRVEQEGRSLNLFESSISVNSQVRALYHKVVCCVCRNDANDSCSRQGRVPLTSSHSDACGRVFRKIGSVTLRTGQTEAAEAAQDNIMSADELARQIKCELSAHCAISGVINNEDVCNYSYINCDCQPFIHSNDIGCVEVIDIVID